MRSFAIYDTQTGEVLRTGQGTSTKTVDLERTRLKPGTALYEGLIDAATQYLPGGVLTSKPVAPATVTPAQVKAHAGRLLSYTDWIIVRAMDTGEPAAPEIVAYRQAVRDASNQIEAMIPIPADYTDAKYWPAQP